jgi:hypothetical protein
MSQAIERLQQMPREMTSEQAAYVLDRSSDFIKRAINSKPAKLEARGDSGRGTGANLRYYISRETLLTYIVRNTSGDRFTLMHSIKELLDKKLHDLALKVAAESTADPQPPSWITSSKQPRTARAARVQADPFADHPDFFRKRTAD